MVVSAGTAQSQSMCWVERLPMALWQISWQEPWNGAGQGDWSRWPWRLQTGLDMGECIVLPGLLLAGVRRDTQSSQKNWSRNLSTRLEGSGAHSPMHGAQHGMGRGTREAELANWNTDLLKQSRVRKRHGRGLRHLLCAHVQHEMDWVPLLRTPVLTVDPGKRRQGRRLHRYPFSFARSPHHHSPPPWDQHYTITSVGYLQLISKDLIETSFTLFSRTGVNSERGSENNPLVLSLKDSLLGQGNCCQV